MIFLVVCYHKIAFTNIIDDPAILEEIGKSMILTVLCLAAYTIAIVVHAGSRTAILKFKISQAKKK